MITTPLTPLHCDNLGQDSRLTYFLSISSTSLLLCSSMRHHFLNMALTMANTHPHILLHQSRHFPRSHIYIFSNASHCTLSTSSIATQSKVCNRVGGWRVIGWVGGGFGGGGPSLATPVPSIGSFSGRRKFHGSLASSSLK